MKVKEFNLLPEKDRFNLEQYVLLKKIITLLLINIFVLSLITMSVYLKNRFIGKLIEEKTRDLAKFTTLLENFVQFQNKFSSLKKRIMNLEAKKRLYFVNYNLKYSPLISLIVLGRNISKGLKINKIEYSKGMFTVIGETNSADSFYTFLEKLNKDTFIKKVNFFYLKKEKKTNFLKFKLKIFMKKMI